MDLPETLTAARAGRGWTQDQTAKALTDAGRPVTTTMVAMLERGERAPSPEMLLAYEEVFGLDFGPVIPALAELRERAREKRRAKQSAEDEAA